MDHPVFSIAQREIEALGVRISFAPTPESALYTVVSARSNLRWWLLPLANGKVAAGGLEMFQPTLTSARWIKRFAILLSSVGLTCLWARPKLYISGTPWIATLFESRPLSFAYFTGTNGQHRKVSAQIMDTSGTPLGFAKVSGNPSVEKLLRHEAAILTRVTDLRLQHANTPNLLHAGEANGVFCLVTDTLKSAGTRSVTVLQPMHRAFLHELREKTLVAAARGIRPVDAIKVRLAGLTDRLSLVWRSRMNVAIERLAACAGELLTLSLVHGDFTPWNTFEADGKLYVFDWEHSIDGAPASHDVIHFLLADASLRIEPPDLNRSPISRHLFEIYGLNKHAAALHLLHYLCSRVLFLVETSPDGADDSTNGLTGWLDYAVWIDTLLTNLKEN